jgi:flagellar biosynthesis/type III secretory pathway M-ring protein FliF/YscJ
MTIVPPVVIIWLIVRYMRKKRREKEEAEAEAADHDTSGEERKS